LSSIDYSVSNLKTTCLAELFNVGLQLNYLFCYSHISFMVYCTAEVWSQLIDNYHVTCMRIPAASTPAFSTPAFSQIELK